MTSVVNKHPFPNNYVKQKILNDWAGSEAGREWLREDVAWLKSNEGRTWLKSNESSTWLKSIQARIWLESEDGETWIDSTVGKAWLKTAAGKQWLATLPGQGHDSDPVQAFSLIEKIKSFFRGFFPGCSSRASKNHLPTEVPTSDPDDFNAESVNRNPNVGGGAYF